MRLHLPERWRPGDRPRRAAAFLARRSVELGWVIAIFFTCELLIWGIYAALRLAGVQFLSPIVGMVAVFLGMLALARVVKRTEDMYGDYLRSKVDFINKNLGVGFPVPMVMFTNKEDIGKVGAMFGNFFATGAVFWSSIFLISWLLMLLILKATPPKNQETDAEQAASDQRRKHASTSNSSETSNPNTKSSSESNPQPNWPTTAADPPGHTFNQSTSSAATSITAVDLEPTAAPAPAPAAPTHLRTWYPVIFATLAALLIGLPISYSLSEDRPLDFSILWLAWVASVKAQSTLRRINIPRVSPDVRRILATFLNPVLLTTFTMAAYTRLKAPARNTPVEAVLSTFSGGATLSQLWAGAAAPGSAFGAGDAALSLLEVGMVTWGFKLYECRRQLFSLSGLSVVLVSVLSAAFSSFVSVAMSRAMAIGAEESLSFAARSTTLALSKPSTTALGGSEMVNACLVVGNGIFGQLIAPWLLRGLRIREMPSEARDGGSERGDGRDSAVEVATGAAVGMNGAAMGVSYLYERKSRAAPYAALSMTAFGVVTTVLASVEPFQSALKKLASL